MMVVILLIIAAPPIAHWLTGYDVIMAMQAGLITGVAIGNIIGKNGMNPTAAIIWSLPMAYAVAFVHPVYVVTVLMVALAAWRNEK